MEMRPTDSTFSRSAVQPRLIVNRLKSLFPTKLNMLRHFPNTHTTAYGARRANQPHGICHGG